MPTHSQGTVKAPVTEFSLGKTVTNSVSSIFENSPIHQGELTEASIKEQYQNEVLDAEINDGGHTFGIYRTSYADAPNIADENAKKNQLFEEIFFFQDFYFVLLLECQFYSFSFCQISSSILL